MTCLSNAILTAYIAHTLVHVMCRWITDISFLLLIFCIYLKITLFLVKLKKHESALVNTVYTLYKCQYIYECQERVQWPIQVNDQA